MSKILTSKRAIRPLTTARPQHLAPHWTREYLVGALFVNKAGQRYMRDLATPAFDTSSGEGAWFPYDDSAVANRPEAYGYCEKYGFGVNTGYNSTTFLANHNRSYPIALSGAAEFTFIYCGEISAFAGTNPGFWRSGTTGSGNDFCIVRGVNNTPWIRVNTVNILFNPSTTLGTIGVGDTSVAYAYSNSSNRDEYAVDINGVNTHSGSHGSANTLSDGVYNVGFQSSSAERIEGIYSVCLFFNKFLEYPIRKSLAENPWQLLRSEPSYYFYTPAAGGAISVPNGNLTLTAGTPKQTMLQIHKVPAHGT